MGILDGYDFAPGTDGAAPPGWLGLALGAPATRAQPIGPSSPALVMPGLAVAATPAPARKSTGPAPRFSYLAPGVRRIDGALTGEKFLQQFSPEVQAAVKAMLDGRAPPVADQRPGFAQAIAAIARRYGQALGAAPDGKSEAPASAPTNPTE